MRGDITRSQGGAVYIITLSTGSRVYFKTGDEGRSAREAQATNVSIEVWRRFAATDTILHYGRA